MSKLRARATLRSAGAVRPHPVARARLRALGISRPIADSVPEAARLLLASQAQDYAAAKWSLGLRVRRASDADVEQCHDEGAILRTHVLRPTWHFVAAWDIRWLLALTGPRILAGNATMHRRLGLDSRTFAKAHRLIQRALEREPHLTREEIGTALERGGIRPAAGQRLAYILMHAELEALVCSGPRRGKQFTYALLDARAARAEPPLDRRDALVRLAERYVPCRGPATVHDLAKWAGLTVADARFGLEGASHRLARRFIDGVEHWEAAHAPPTQTRASHTHLLSVFDEYISSYRDRSTLISPEHGRMIVQRGAAVTQVIVVEGWVRGLWSRKVGAKGIAVHLEPFAPLSRAARAALAASAERYGRFFGVPVTLS